MRHFTKYELLMLLLSTAYIVLPFDLLPEMFLGPLGLIDDAAAFAIIVSLVSAARRRAAEPATIDGQVIPPQR